MLAGIVAVGAAVIGALAALRAARIGSDAAASSRTQDDDRRRKFFGSVVAEDLSSLRSRCRLAEGVIVTLHAGNHHVTEDSRRQMRLTLHPILNDWSFMSLLDDAFLRRLAELQRVVADHNYDVERAGTFTVDAWRESVIARLNRISGSANELRGQATLIGRGGQVAS
jgi:hypothetical protein